LGIGWNLVGVFIGDWLEFGGEKNFGNNGG